MQFRITVYFKETLVPPISKNYDTLPAAHEAAIAFCRSPKVSRVDLFILIHSYR